MKKSLFVSCDFLRIKVLINYLPIHDYFLKSLILSVVFTFILGGSR